MPRDEGRALIEISTTGLRRNERLTRLNRRDVAQEIQFSIEAIGEAAAFVLQTNAPFRTGHLKENIGITGRNRSTHRPSIRVGADVRSPEGFPYIPVTRRGRKAVVAKRRSSPARTYRQGTGRGHQKLSPSGKNPHRAAMLRFEPGPPGSGFIFRRRVRAYRPTRDWVLVADFKIRSLAQREINDLTEKIELTLEREGRTGRGPRRVRIKRF